MASVNPTNSPNTQVSQSPITQFDPDCFQYILSFSKSATETFYSNGTTLGLFEAQQASANGGLTSEANGLADETLLDVKCKPDLAVTTNRISISSNLHAASSLQSSAFTSKLALHIVR
ncbi:hypothetical protein DL96DRAFT_1681765 [Flagelloscypha sp. PMI_526]|nr:hypothetical protein DL96DRAFT_1681765 [Flagelloscypha sp. PMI_526]